MSQGMASGVPGPQPPVVQMIGQTGSRHEDEDAVKIGLWGPPQSGKTTFLAALPIALGDDARNGSWNIYPYNDASWDLLERFEKVLVEDRRFPQSTVDSQAQLEWLFVGHLARSRFDGRRLRRLRRRELESRFMLDLIDVHGEAYRRDPDRPEAGASPAAAAALDHLAEAQGIIYLFDPIGERDNRNSAAYVRGTVNDLLRRAANGGRPGRYLPHQLSVVITKFDHPEMFEQARNMSLVTYGDDGMPRVRDEHAEQFFDELCSDKFWNGRFEHGQQSALYVRKKLKQVFRPDHIRYFVTSAIGFWMEPPTEDDEAPRFDLHDCSNLDQRDGLPAIRGMVRPINVLEPLISLQRRIAEG